MPLIIDRVTYKYLINDVVKVTKKLKNFFQKVIHPLKDILQVYFTNKYIVL